MAHSALMRLYDDGGMIFCCSTYVQVCVCEREKTCWLRLKISQTKLWDYQAVWKPGTVSSGSSSSTHCVCACHYSLEVLTPKMTFISPLSWLISREDDGKLICTCSLPAVWRIPHKLTYIHVLCVLLTSSPLSSQNNHNIHSRCVLTPPWGCWVTVSAKQGIQWCFHHISRTIFSVF